MAVTTTTNSSFGILVNNEASNGYTSSATKDLLFTLAFINTVTGLNNETNYELQIGIPTPVINGALTLNIDKTSLNATAEYVGIRLVSDASTDANASKFSFTAGSDFETPATPLAISQSTDPASTGNILWSTAPIAQEASGLLQIPLTLNYIAAAKTPGDSVTYTLELYQNNSTTSGTPALKGSASVTTDTSAALTITSWTAVVASEISAYNQANFATSPTSFAIGEKIALKTNLATDATPYHKRVSTITTTLVIPIAIALDTDYATPSPTADYIYITALNAPADLAALNTDAEDTTTGVTVKVPIATDSATGVTLTTDASNNTIQIAIDPTYYAKIFETVDTNTVLKTPVDVYVTGKVNATS